MDKPSVGLLSTHVILGGVYPQTGAYIEQSENGEIYGACLIGGAILTASEGMNPSLVKARQLWPWIATMARCPMCDRKESIGGIISYHFGLGCRSNKPLTRHQAAAYIRQWEQQFGLIPAEQEAEHVAAAR